MLAPCESWRAPATVRTGEPHQAIRSIGRRPSIRSCSFLLGLSLSFLFPSMVLSQSRNEGPTVITQTTVQPARTPSPYIGSVMALLATFEDAGVLPPEGTPQANGVIKAVIQFQSAFLKSRDPAVRQFFMDAQRAKFGTDADAIETSFRRGGWSAETFDAVIEAGQQTNDWSANGLREGFQEFNIGRADFDMLAQLYRQSTALFSAQNTTFQEVYAQRRREMPGAESK